LKVACPRGEKSSGKKKGQQRGGRPKDWSLIPVFEEKQEKMGKDQVRFGEKLRGVLDVRLADRGGGSKKPL